MTVRTVDTAPLLIAPPDAGRINIYFRNQSAGGQVVVLVKANATGLAATAYDYVLSPGEWLSFNVSSDGDDLKGAWSAVASGAGAILVWSDMSEDLTKRHKAVTQ